MGLPALTSVSSFLALLLFLRKLPLADLLRSVPAATAAAMVWDLRVIAAKGRIGASVKPTSYLGALMSTSAICLTRKRWCHLLFALLDIFKEEIPLHPNESLMKWHSPLEEEIFLPQASNACHSGNVTPPPRGRFSIPKYATQGSDPRIFPF